MARAASASGAILGILAALLTALFLFGAREPLDLVPDFDGAQLPDDLDAYLAGREAVVGGVLPGAEKRIVWDGAAGARTEWAVVYLHGFSATAEEIRPVPDLVAKGLGANLYFTRFAGHGLGPERFAGPSVNDWMIDVAEALAIGRRIGRRTLVIATSTGGTLAAEAALQPALARQMDAVAFVSPNFALQSRMATLLTWPHARSWVGAVAGEERCFQPVNAAQARFWTTCYPTVALLPMAALARHAGRADYSAVNLPALFLFAEADAVVSPGATRKVASSWGGPVTVAPQVVAEGGDPSSHLIAGDALSPAGTAPVSAAILDWVRAE
ncbi:MAG: alpha/beta hydrolase [Rhodobacteraceae bacterium]|nr:alpha/beta hydrolase [Paracoccaceae bacterium]